MPSPDSSGLICCRCKQVVILEAGQHPEEVRRVPAGPICEGCYYGAVGELVEEHPIPGVVRR